MGTRLRRLATEQLTPVEVSAIRELLWAAFEPDDEGFTEQDWEHGLGGVHFVLDFDGEIVTHAAVVEREIRVGGLPLKTGYVEAVATADRRQGEGFGTRVMEDVTSFIRERFQLGVLGTGRHHFYERLGWQVWMGPSFVRTTVGTEPTPDDDGYILVLPTRSSPPLDLSASIECDWRTGDVW